MIKELRQVVSDHYPHVEPAFYFRCQRKIRSFFPLKDCSPMMMNSGVIYKYTCDCSQSYIGSTAVNLYIRVCQHRGVSFRTGNQLSRPPNSSIRDHCNQCTHPVKKENFSIVDRHPEESSLRILESIHIKKMRPRINECGTAVPLYVCC